MKSIKHKNIVQYKGDFRQKGEWYVAIEYCSRGDMETYKKNVGKYYFIKEKYQNIIVNYS